MNSYPMSFYLFLIWTFVLIGRPQDIFLFLTPFRLAFVFTIINVLSTFLGSKRRPASGPLNAPRFKKYMLFYIVMIVGIPFAYYSRRAFNFVFLEYVVSLVYFYIFLMQVDSLKKIRSVSLLIVFSTLLYALASLLQGTYHAKRLSFGTMYDPNDLAYLLVAFFPLSFIFLLGSKRKYEKLLSLLNICIANIVILLTGSRAGILGLVVVWLLILFSNLTIMKKPAKFILLIVLGGLFASQASNIPLERYNSILRLDNDYNVSGEFGRLSIWEKGIKLTFQHPITGVGAGCFGQAIGEMRSENGLPERWQTAHNSYLLVSAETGIGGLFLFVSIIFGTLGTFIRYCKTKTLSNNPIEMQRISGAFLVGFLGSLICAFFLSQAYSMTFTLFFALSTALSRSNEFKQS